MDGLEWKTLLFNGWFGAVSLFSETLRCFGWVPLRIVKQSRSWRHLFLRLKAQRSESPAGSDLRGVFFEGGRWVKFPYIWWFQVFFDVQGGPKNQL